MAEAMKKTNASSRPTRASIDEFELVAAQLQLLHVELQGLAKGKGNDALNAFKLTLLNNLLTRANALLGEKYAAIQGFVQFDSENLPSISDAIIVVSQYLGALEKYRSDNIAVKPGGTWCWVIGGEITSIRTPAPAKLDRR